MAQVKAQIDSIDDNQQDYIEKGVLLIELAKDFENIYKTKGSDVKRKLIEAASSIHVLRNGSIEFEYRKPFDILAKSGEKVPVDPSG